MDVLHTHAHVKLNSHYVSTANVVFNKTGFSSLFYSLINFIDYEVFNIAFKETYDEVLNTTEKVNNQYSFDSEFFDDKYEKLFVLTLLGKILSKDDIFAFKNDIELKDFSFDSGDVIEGEGLSLKSSLKYSMQKAIESLELSKPTAINLDLEDVIELQPYCAEID